ncbi:MAG: DNA cytosine methyltransferase [Bacillota bacterium]
MREIIVDNFAGGGGASTGIALAIGRSVDIAVNHDAAAIQMHRRNHPDTKHYIEDVWAVDPVKACCGRPVGLAWFSPDCTHHSKARGGKPREQKIRGLAWLAVKWASLVKPRVIMLENVTEFQTWGPLLKDMTPDPKRKGETFRSFVNALKHFGYKVEWRELRACDYGAPTIRKRLFLIARCDDRKIVWPEPSHAAPNDIRVLCGDLEPWPVAADIIDWDINCPSIFTRKKPLADNTMKRIAKGLKKFVLDSPSPFIINIDNKSSTGVAVSAHVTKFRGESPGSDIEKPLATITSGAGSARPGGNAHAMGLVQATFINRQFGQSIGNSVDEPLGTITAGGGGKSGVVATFLTKYHGDRGAGDNARGQRSDEPVRTVDTSNRFGLVSAFMAKHYGGGYTGCGSDLKEPIHTITSVDHNHLVTSHLIKLKGTNIGTPDTEPVPTICAGGLHIGEVRSFMIKYYGCGTGQPIDDPVHTITTKDRLGLVTIHGEAYAIVDIGMRMLEPHELFAAQGFPKDYKIDGMPKYEQVAKCGNSVSPVIPKALVEANLPEMCGEVEEVA